MFEEVIAEHLAFRMPSAEGVQAREAALARDEIYPLFRGEEHPEFRPGYFSATWIDPDGIALELYAVPERARRGRRRAARTRTRGSARVARGKSSPRRRR